MEIEIKRLEMEMNQKQFELKQQLELAKLTETFPKQKKRPNWLSFKLNLQKPSSHNFCEMEIYHLVVVSTL